VFGRARDALKKSQLDSDATQAFTAILAQAVVLSQHQRLIVQDLLMGMDEQAKSHLKDHQVFELQRKLVMELQVFGNQQHAITLQTQQQALDTQHHARSMLLGLGAVLFVLGMTLGTGVIRFISRFEKALDAEKQRAESEARHDPLTGLLNRRGFEAELTRWGLQHPLKGKDGHDGHDVHALLLIDLDKFKPINDQAGHEAGDAVLQRISELFQSGTRPQDLVARLGGDEFAIVLHQMNADKAMEVAQRLRQTVQDFTFDWHDLHFKLGTSMGLVEFSSRVSTAQWSDAMRRADDACYEAKHQGRNRVCVG
jgi:diguanylate cyclase (GGDEF)-like protein